MVERDPEFFGWERTDDDDSDAVFEAPGRGVGQDDETTARLELRSGRQDRTAVQQVERTDSGTVLNRRILSREPDEQTARESAESWASTNEAPGAGPLSIDGHEVNRVRLAGAQDAHQDRSARSRTLDEKKSAQVTTDYGTWKRNPDRYDYPGVDTVQPEELHEQRSERAQVVDEQHRAPLADSKEQWAQNPDRYDWQGVDTPAATGRPDQWQQMEALSGGSGTRPDRSESIPGLEQEDELFGSGSPLDGIGFGSSEDSDEEEDLFAESERKRSSGSSSTFDPFEGQSSLGDFGLNGF